MRRITPQRAKKIIPTKELVDQDYWSKLSKEEKDFLNKFNQEYYFASGLNKSSSLHKGELRKKPKKAQREREKQVITEISDPSIVEVSTTPDPTDALIEALDKKRRTKNRKKKGIS